MHLLRHFLVLPEILFHHPVGKDELQILEKYPDLKEICKQFSNFSYNQRKHKQQRLDQSEKQLKLELPLLDEHM